MPSRSVRPGLTRILKTYPLLCISYSSTPANRSPGFRAFSRSRCAKMTPPRSKEARGALTTADNECLCRFAAAHQLDDDRV